MEDALLLFMLEDQVEIDPGPSFCDKLPITKSGTYEGISNQKGKTHTMGYVTSGMTKTESAKWQKLRTKVLKRDKNKCRRCDSKRLLTAHHIKPRSEGGKNIMHNLITLCDACHDWVETIKPKRIRRIKI